MVGRIAPRTLQLSFTPALACVLLLCACAGAPAPGGPTAAPAAAPAVAPVPAPAPVPQLKPTRPPESMDTAERYAWQAVVQLGEAFAAGDVEGFLGRVSHGFYRGYPALETAVRTLVRTTSDRRVVVAVSAVRREDERFTVDAEWTVRRTRSGLVEERYGKTSFHFLRTDTSLRLIDYRGDAPFGIEGN